MRFLLYFSVLTLSFSACKSPEAQRPVQQSGTSFIESSVERNKRIYEEDQAQIEALIDATKDKIFFTSDNGFWYTYQIKDSIDGPNPVFGDEISFKYNIKDLDGRVILSEEENGLQTIRVDQSNQELISGLREGLKLMQVGETVTFLFPSYKAYGYYGIENKLGSNVPVQSTVTLTSINKNN
jgi:gliding motility-associated peptidyl-prolyl isomerase